MIPLDETFERRGVYTISSIGSVPKEIPGIPMKGELFAFTDWDIGRLAGYPTVFSAGNVVTGKGNIVASRKHAREVSATVIEAFLGVGENGSRGRGAARRRDRRRRARERGADRRRDRGAAADQRGRARRGARARAQAPAGGGLRRRLRRLGPRRVGRPDRDAPRHRFAALAAPVRSRYAAASTSASSRAPRFPPTASRRSSRARPPRTRSCAGSARPTSPPTARCSRACSTRARSPPRTSSRCRSPTCSPSRSSRATRRS